MSIAEFSTGMQNHIMSTFKNAKIGSMYINPLYTPISRDDAIRTHEQQAHKTNFIISKNTIAEIRAQLIKYYPNMPSAETLYQRAEALTNKYTAKPIKVPNPTGLHDTVLVYEKVEFKRGIDSILIDIFNTGNKQESEGIRNALVGQHGGIFQKGHVIGIASNLLEQSAQQGMIPDYAVDKNIGAALEAINLAIKELRKADIATSNFVSEEVYKALGSYIKTPNQYIVELQIKGGNSSSGGKVGNDIEKLRKVLKEDTDKDIIKALDNMGTNKTFAETVVKMRGSPSMLQLIEASILEALDPIQFPKTKKTYFANNIPIAQFTNKISINKDKLKQSLQKEIVRLEQLKSKLVRDAKGRSRNQKGQFASLANIQILLNARIHDQIKQNMGTGDRKDILNLRTGRFAETVQIERLNLQRDNAIAIFYSYMKYPYQTFEPGYEQGAPTSRNPITLINKSIRDIATTLVTNRLRMFSI